MSMLHPGFREGLRAEASALVVPVFADAEPLGWPKYPHERAGAPPVLHMSLGDALYASHATDAHFACYRGDPRVVRRLGMNEDKKGSGVTLWEAVEAGLIEVAMIALVFDADAPDKKPTPEWRATCVAAHRALPPGGVYYETRGGCRMLWQLAEPHPIRSPDCAATWRASYLRACDAVDLALLTASQRASALSSTPPKTDRACADWTRLFRLPRVVRDGVATRAEFLGGGDGAWQLEIVRAVAPPPSLAPPILSGELAERADAGIRRVRERVEARARLRERFRVAPPERDALALVALGEAWPGANTGNQAAFAIGCALAEECPDIGADAAVEVARDCLAATAVHATDPLERLEARCAAGYDHAVREPVEVPPDPDCSQAGSTTPSTWPDRFLGALAEVRGVTGANPFGAPTLPEPIFEQAGEFLARAYPPVPWLAKNLIKRGGTLLVGGEPKVGKSWALTEISLALVTGTPVFGHFAVPEPLRVAYFFAEDLGGDVQAHIRALLTGRGATDEHRALVAKNLYVQPRGRFLDLMKDEDMALVVASCRRFGHVDAVFLEPLRDLHSGKENESDDMSAVMKRLRLVGEMLGATPGTVHHNKKGADGRGGENVRGSGAIWGAVDSGLYLMKPTGNGINVLGSECESEVKGARSGGKFRVELSIQDGDDDRAKVATWTWAKLDAPPPGQPARSDDGSTVSAEREMLDDVAVANHVRWLLQAGAPPTVRELRASGAQSGREDAPKIPEKRAGSAIERLKGRNKLRVGTALDGLYEKKLLPSDYVAGGEQPTATPTRTTW